MVHDASLRAADSRPSVCGDLTANDRRNVMRYNAWMLGWMALWAGVLMLVAKAGLAGPVAWALAALTVVPGVIGVSAYIRFLREADELLRKIQLEALAIAFSVGVVFMMTWRLFERLGAPTLDLNTPVLVMFVVWAAAQWWNARRYR